jgi:hypothetical protein
MRYDREKRNETTEIRIPTRSHSRPDRGYSGRHGIPGGTVKLLRTAHSITSGSGLVRESTRVAGVTILRNPGSRARRSAVNRGYGVPLTPATRTRDCCDTVSRSVAQPCREEVRGPVTVPDRDRRGLAVRAFSSETLVTFLVIIFDPFSGFEIQPCDASLAQRRDHCVAMEANVACVPVTEASYFDTNHLGVLKNVS